MVGLTSRKHNEALDPPTVIPAVPGNLNKNLCAAPAGQTDPGAPLRADGTRKRTYKTKKETDKTRNVTSTIVLTLLGISVIVPMLQVRALRLLSLFLCYFARAVGGRACMHSSL